MFPLLNRSTYSILQSVIKIKPLVAKAKEYGYAQLGLIDINTLGGVYDFIEECNENDILPVIGAQFSTINHNHQVVYIAKNLNGWKSLLKLNSQVQRNGHLTLEDIEQHKNGLMCWVVIGPTQPFADIFKADLLTFTTVDSLDVRYLEEQYREDYLLVRCSERKTTLKELIDDFPATHLPTKEELEDIAEHDSLEYARLLENIEPINLKHDPILPSYDKGEFESEIALLRHLCREGWKRRYRNSWNVEVYGERVKHELSVIEEFDMAGYFLIVQDLVNYGKRKGWLYGSSRGSAGGSLVSYLIGITETDPIPHNLLFERFVNPDRAPNKYMSFNEYPKTTK